MVNCSAMIVLADCDSVRLRVERYLFAGDLVGLQEFSEKLDRSVKECAKSLRDTMNAEVVVAAGDDLLVKIDLLYFDAGRLREAIRLIELAASVTVSVGGDLSIEGAFVNLARAKAVGGGWVISGV